MENLVGIDYLPELIAINNSIKAVFILLSIYCGLDIGMKISKK